MKGPRSRASCGSKTHAYQVCGIELRRNVETGEFRERMIYICRRPLAPGICGKEKDGPPNMPPLPVPCQEKHVYDGTARECEGCLQAATEFWTYMAATGY